MGPRPFPLPFRVGVDICSIDRIIKLVSAKVDSDLRALHSFKRRLFTPQDEAAFRKRFPDHSTRWVEAHYRLSVGRYLAARWAAKEAVIKAAQPRRLTFHQIVIARTESSEPYAIVLDDAAPDEGHTRPEDPDANANANANASSTQLDTQSDIEAPDPNDLNLLEGQVARLSISHDGNWATAACIAWVEPSTHRQAR